MTGTPGIPSVAAAASEPPWQLVLEPGAGGAVTARWRGLTIQQAVANMLAICQTLVGQMGKTSEIPLIVPGAMVPHVPPQN
jgi:hypothetical protein